MMVVAMSLATLWRELQPLEEVEKEVNEQQW